MGLLYPALGFGFDVFDGKVARWSGSASMLGQEMDSLADLVSFKAFFLAREGTGTWETARGEWERWAKVMEQVGRTGEEREGGKEEERELKGSRQGRSFGWSLREESELQTVQTLVFIADTLS